MRLSGSKDGAKPVDFIQQSEAVQQDGHVTISWNYSGASICLCGGENKKLSGWIVQWMDGWAGRKIDG